MALTGIHLESNAEKLSRIRRSRGLKRSQSLPGCGDTKRRLKKFLLFFFFFSFPVNVTRNVFIQTQAEKKNTEPVTEGLKFSGFLFVNGNFCGSNAQAVLRGYLLQKLQGPLLITGQSFVLQTLGNADPGQPAHGSGILTGLFPAASDGAKCGFLGQVPELLSEVAGLVLLQKKCVYSPSCRNCFGTSEMLMEIGKYLD